MHLSSSKRRTREMRRLYWVVASWIAFVATGAVWAQDASNDSIAVEPGRGVLPGGNPHESVVFADGTEAIIRDVTQQDEKELILAGHDDWVTGISFSPDGSRVASSSRDRTIRVWDARTGVQLLVLKKSADAGRDGHTGYVQSVAFSPDGRYLASAGADKAIFIWNAECGRALSCLSANAYPVLDVTYSPDGARLASADGKAVKIWDSNPESHNAGYILSLDAEGATRARFSRDGQSVAALCRNHVIRIWNTVTGNEVSTLNDPNDVRVIGFGRDETLVSAGTHGITVWSLSTGKATQTWNHAVEADRGALSPDGTHLAVAAPFDVLAVINVTTGRETIRFKGHRNTILAIAFGPNGKRIASSSKDRTIRFWNLDESGER